MSFVRLTRNQLITAAVLVVAIAFVEFVAFEQTFGISLPSGRKSAISTVEIRTQSLQTHYVTHNRRFTVVENAPGTIINAEPLVLREHFFWDKQVGREGPPDAILTVEAMRDGSLKWSFQAAGERGDVVTSNLYRVVTYGNGERPNIYTYFSLADGRKLLTNRSSELSTSELESLDASVARQGQGR